MEEGQVVLQRKACVRKKGGQQDGEQRDEHENHNKKHAREYQEQPDTFFQGMLHALLSFARAMVQKVEQCLRNDQNRSENIGSIAQVFLCRQCDEQKKRKQKQTDFGHLSICICRNEG